MDKVIELKKYIERGISLVVIKNSEIIFQSDEHGIEALFNLLNSKPYILNDSIVLDRKVGRAAALLLVKGRIKELATIELSKSAEKLLIQYDISYTVDALVENIIGRNNKVCKLELIAKDKTPEDFFLFIKNQKIFYNVL